MAFIAMVFTCIPFSMGSRHALSMKSTLTKDVAFFVENESRPQPRQFKAALWLGVSDIVTDLAHHWGIGLHPDADLTCENDMVYEVTGRGPKAATNMTVVGTGEPPVLITVEKNDEAVEADTIEADSAIFAPYKKTNYDGYVDMSKRIENKQLGGKRSFVDLNGKKVERIVDEKGRVNVDLTEIEQQFIRPWVQKHPVYSFSNGDIGFDGSNCQQFASDLFHYITGLTFHQLQITLDTSNFWTTLFAGFGDALYSSGHIESAMHAVGDEHADEIAASSPKRLDEYKETDMTTCLRH
mmetsp:Transcript_106678/g.188900  ORF Transcript_106678/g.188900 Transcript_106678/m.188900 type:complete len:296 (+) Transcript_106678:87-974(+)